MSPIINYLIQYMHFRSLNTCMMTYLSVKFKQKTCVGTFVTLPLKTCLLDDLRDNNNNNNNNNNKKKKKKKKKKKTIRTFFKCLVLSLKSKTS